MIFSQITLHLKEIFSNIGQDNIRKFGSHSTWSCGRYSKCSLAVEKCSVVATMLELFLHDVSMEYWASWLCVTISREGTFMVVSLWHLYNEAMHLLELWGAINSIISKVLRSLVFNGT